MTRFNKVKLPGSLQIRPGLFRSPLRSRFGLLFLWLAMFWNGAHWINRVVDDLSNITVLVAVLEEILPFSNALREKDQCQTGKKNLLEETILTASSASVSPRRSCVRWSLKQPVANERAASTPALLLTSDLHCGESIPHTLSGSFHLGRIPLDWGTHHRHHRQSVVSCQVCGGYIVTKHQYTAR